jgi:hypothetical protein
MPWVLLVLFGAGLGMVWLRYLPVLAALWRRRSAHCSASSWPWPPACSCTFW